MHILSSTHIQVEQLTLLELIKSNYSTALPPGITLFFAFISKYAGQKPTKVFEMAEGHKLLKLRARTD